MSLDSRKRIVAEGYDRIAERYLDWTENNPVRFHFLARLADIVPPGGSALDIGCGAGTPVTKELAKRFTTVGVDISKTQVELARKTVPDAEFVHADIMAVSFPLASFRLVTAFYALTHLPRAELPALLGRVWDWLEPGGFFLASLGAGDNPDGTEADWLGEPMFFSHFDAEANEALVRSTGFAVIDSETIAQQEDGSPVPFLWVLGQRPLSASPPRR